MYRLYIDETGNADLGASSDPNHRYLSLTGVIMEVDYVLHRVRPELERIKRDIFGSDPDDPVILHRKDLLQKNHPFKALRDPAVEAEFNRRTLGLLRDSEYTTLTVVIDKLEHLNRYVVWRHDPYHYCLEILLERYVKWLRKTGGKGDILAEVRGKKDDIRLKRCYDNFYKNGTRYMRSSTIQWHITSAHLKMKPKPANITGLQICDLLAHPSAAYVRYVYDGGPGPTGFGLEIAHILYGLKYDRAPNGDIGGWGIKWLP